MVLLLRSSRLVFLSNMVLAKATPDPLLLLLLEAQLPELVLARAVQQQPPVGCVSCVCVPAALHSPLLSEGLSDI